VSSATWRLGNRGSGPAARALGWLDRESRWADQELRMGLCRSVTADQELPRVDQELLLAQKQRLFLTRSGVPTAGRWRAGQRLGRRRLGSGNRCPLPGSPRSPTAGLCCSTDSPCRRRQRMWSPVPEGHGSVLWWVCWAGPSPGVSAIPRRCWISCWGWSTPSLREASATEKTSSTAALQLPGSASG
jgi:hypothetical protein